MQWSDWQLLKEADDPESLTQVVKGRMKAGMEKYGRQYLLGFNYKF